MSDQVCENTDRHLFENDQGRVHVTKGGEGLGINVGGFVITLPLKTWHALASGAPRPEVDAQLAVEELKIIHFAERFNREKFTDDTDFADWACNRIMHTLYKIDPSLEPQSSQDK